ncbi:hypothetical protein CEK29_16360 [Bordetella genomosp. 5]|uniref:Lipoprotein n=1 Tax=Bordetella genomosp. 5 TaxID=1395608 RepID=A0A261TET5_9BORD|nr:hypothetical protein [Bordetella genomosp. 5]OZI41494.1 hypothetical protein CEK29_16360 [Bordetella genomosp. 5]OZI48148.1 hypothetical protein CAL25_17410 [Bordetella genomosp. 5]
MKMLMRALGGTAVLALLGGCVVVPARPAAVVRPYYSQPYYVQPYYVQPYYRYPRGYGRPYYW